MRDSILGIFPATGEPVIESPGTLLDDELVLLRAVEAGGQGCEGCGLRLTPATIADRWAIALVGGDELNPPATVLRCYDGPHAGWTIGDSFVQLAICPAEAPRLVLQLEPSTPAELARQQRSRELTNAGLDRAIAGEHPAPAKSI